MACTHERNDMTIHGQDRNPGTEEDHTGLIRVECYAGQRAAESPRRFFLGRREVKVTEIIDRWLDPDYSYFKLRGDDAGIYILRHDRTTDTWEMTLYDSGTHEGSRLSTTREA
jgi:hypothetical protein